MQQILGPFHPVFVHLPIGILLIACLFQWLVVKEKYKKLEPAVGITLFWGTIFAILSCITGLMLSQTGDYEGELVSKHQWMGITVAVVAIIQYYLFKKSINTSFARWLALILVLLIVITGHLGGSLTHGSDYLTKAFSETETNSASSKKPIPDVQVAKAYADIIEPILHDKCYGCHAANKQKGKLRLDKPDLILKGGKEGNTLIAGDANKSELIKRLLLARNEEHHMPPKEKPQLTEAEVSLLHWWVQSGASFDKAVNELNQPDKIKPVLTALQSRAPAIESSPDIPLKEPSAASSNALEKVKKRGIMLLPIKQNSNFLQANFINADSLSAKDIELLLPLKDQLIWVKLSNQPVNDQSIKILASIKNIRRLYLDHTNITDEAFVYLKQIDSLQLLNLFGTKISAKGVLQLKEMKNLKSVYLYQTGVNAADWTILKNAFPKTFLDSGNYKLPLLQGDTSLVREPQK